MEKIIKDLTVIKACCENLKNNKSFNDIYREMYADWAFMISNAITLLKQLQSKANNMDKDVESWQ